MDLRSTLGRWLQHTLLRNEGGHQWPFVEKWELDWAVADPVGYRHRRVPAWFREVLTLTEAREDLSARRTTVRPAPGEVARSLSSEQD